MKKYILILLLSACVNNATASYIPLSVWIKNFKIEARHNGISNKILNEVFADFKPIKRIIQLDRKQPEGRKTFRQYKKTVLSDRRIKEGRKLYKENYKLLNEIGNKYGVDPQFIVALWGIETSYGKITGGFSVPHALATLAYDGRRAKFFRKELINSLKIINEGHIKFSKMKGSWAGAMGQSQFMPSSFLDYAVDYDGDGRKDIWQTKPDIFASIANYLSKSGWKKGAGWGINVTVPKNFNKSYINLKNYLKFYQYLKLGVKPLNNNYHITKNSKSSLIYIDDTRKDTFIIVNNYRVIMKWNRSRYFATSVGILSDKIIKGSKEALK